MRKRVSHGLPAQFSLLAYLFSFLLFCAGVNYYDVYSDNLFLFAFQEAPASTSTAASDPTSNSAAPRTGRTGRTGPSARVTCNDRKVEHVVLMNSKAHSRWGSLLLPSYWQQRPQVLGRPEDMAVAVAFAQQLSSPYMRDGYNSLGAGASVNHLVYRVH